MRIFLTCVNRLRVLHFAGINCQVDAFNKYVVIEALKHQSIEFLRSLRRKSASGMNKALIFLGASMHAKG